MSRNARVFAAIPLCLAAACGPRPPDGMTRLDSGSMNHGFQVDQRLQRLFYIDGGGSFQTSLVVRSLETGKSRSYRFGERQIEMLHPSSSEDAVNLGARVTHLDDRFRRGAETYAVMKVDASDGRVLAEERLSSYEAKDVTYFRNKLGRGAPDAPLPASSLSGMAVAAAYYASTAPADGQEEGSSVVSASIADAPAPGVRTAKDMRSGRSARFFPTASRPVELDSNDGGLIYADYRGKDGLMAVEELDSGTGARRVIGRFKGDIQSMTISGMGLLLLRRESEGPRTLTLLDAASGRVALDLPWTDGDSRLLAADPARRRLYLTMQEGRFSTAWAVPLDTATLRAASDYLAVARAPKKVTRRMVLTMWLCVIFFLVLLASAVSGRGSGGVM